MPIIQLRLGDHKPANEHMEIGEPIIDDSRARFGFFNGRSATAIEWYPCIVNGNLLLNPQQTLGGKVSDTVNNPIIFDWSLADTLRIKHAVSGAVLATFTAAGTSFNNLLASGVAFPGIANQLINGNFKIKRKVKTTEVYDTASDNYRSTLFAPNWQVWRTNGTSGRLILSYDTAERRPFKEAGNVIRVLASGACNSSGVRTFLHGNYDTSTLTFSTYIYGPNGARTKVRAVTQKGNVLFNEDFVADGTFKRFSKTVTMPDDNSFWTAFDTLYNPSYNTPNQQEWLISESVINVGSAAAMPEIRSDAIERSLCLGVYKEGKINIRDAADISTVELPGFDFVKVEAYDVASNRRVVVSGAEAIGFNVNMPTAAGNAQIKYAAYSMPTVAETA